MGFAECEHFVEELKQSVSFQISNNFILPEFQHIIRYFAKALHVRKWRIEAKIYLQDGKLHSTQAISTDIGRINEKLIEVVKYQRSIGITKKPLYQFPDKSLFTADDLYESFEGELNAGNVFNQSAENLIELLISNEKVRNKKQLNFLADQIQSAQHKIRITLQPYLGFLFTYNGNTQIHFIWELLNSHASYIWSFDLEITKYQEILNITENQINLVRSIGRENYKRSYLNNQILPAFVFHAIDHEHVGSALIDGFAKWKIRIEEKLV